MNLLNARVFLQKHKKIIIVSELGILFVILFLLCKSINIISAGVTAMICFLIGVLMHVFLN